jgi:hypothetical protein
LNHRVVAQHEGLGLRDLGRGQRDKGIERAAREAEPNGGKAGAVEMEGGKAIERSRLATVGRGLAGERICVRDEQIFDHVIVAAGAFEADHAPDVVDPRARLRDQHGALGRLAVGTKTRRAVRLDDGAVTAEPAGVLDAAREAPAP